MKSVINGFTGIAMCMLVSYSAAAQQANDISQKGKEEIINKAVSLLYDNYFFAERVKNIQAYVTKKLTNKGYDTVKGTEAFLEMLNNDLEQQGHDHHLDIFYGPKRVKQIRAEEKDTTERVLTNEWMQLLQYENFRLRKVERLDGNVGYLNFLGFAPLAPAKATIAAAMDFLHYSAAIVIDLRENGGGSAETMNFLLSYFVEEGKPIAELRYRQGGRVEKTYTVHDTIIHRIPAGTPVYLLVSNNTSSAAEGFAYALQQWGRAVVVGEQTKGEGNPGKLFVINDSLYIMVPTAEYTNAVSKLSIDGVGVVPGIKTDAQKAYAAGLLHAYKYLAEKAVDKEQKQLYAWQIPLLENELQPQLLTDTIVNALVGDYEGGRKIIFENCNMQYINGAGKKVRIDYIGNGVFQQSQNKFLRLLMPYTNKPVEAIKWAWDDGGTQKIGRIK